MPSADCFRIYLVQPKVSTRVGGATELGTKISQSEAAAVNVWVMLELEFVADWPPQRLNSVAPSTRIDTPLAELTTGRLFGLVEPCRGHGLNTGVSSF